MKRPYRMQYVLDAACVVVLAVNLPFAIYGYLLFGSFTDGQLNCTLTLNSKVIIAESPLESFPPIQAMYLRIFQEEALWAYSMT